MISTNCSNRLCLGRGHSFTSSLRLSSIATTNPAQSIITNETEYDTNSNYESNITQASYSEHSSRTYR